MDRADRWTPEAGTSLSRGYRGERFVVTEVKEGGGGYNVFQHSLDFPNPLSLGLALGDFVSTHRTASVSRCDRLGVCAARRCTCMCEPLADACSNCCPFT